MILHNLKVAWRNLIKYKTQTLVSIVALAVGMVTLAATHFVLKHMGPPSIAHEPYYDRCYVMRFRDVHEAAKMDSIFDGNKLKSFKASVDRVTPEMESALKADGGLPGVEKTIYNSFMGGTTMGGGVTFTMPDSTTRELSCSFNVVQAEKLNFYAIRSAVTGEKIPVLNDKEAVISEVVARQVYGDENPIGCTITLWYSGKWKTTFVIRDVYRAEQLNDGVTNSIYLHAEDSQDNYIRELCLLLAEGFSPEQVQKEADRRLLPLGIKSEMMSIAEADAERVQSRLFVSAVVYLISSLILVAALIGFLKMQLQLFAMRRREVSLRRVHGAKGVSIMGLFFCEMIITILFASVVALLLGNLLADYASTLLISYLDEFGWRVEGINESLFVIAVAVAIICTAVVWGCVQGLLRSRQAMAAQMHRNRRHTLRNGMLGLQIFVSILFLGGTLALSQLIVLFEKQMNIPPNDDFYARCISVRPYRTIADSQRLLEYLQTEAKGIKQYIAVAEGFERLGEVEDLKEEAENVLGPSTFFRTLHVSDTAIFDFWQRPIRWLLPPEERSNCILLTDSLYNRLSRLGITAKGALDIRNKSMQRIGGTFSVLPYLNNSHITHVNMMIQIGADDYNVSEFIIVPEDGQYNRVFTDICDVMQRINPEPVKPTVVNLRKKLTGELFLLDNMQRGAWILSAICFVICFMGIWSSISLDTRSRQKEVAVRKVHGAKRKDVVLLFGRLYLWLIGVVSVLSIPMMIQFNALLQEWGRQMDVPSELISPVMPIVTSIVVVSLVIAVVVGIHIRKVMKLQPADIIAKE